MKPRTKILLLLTRPSDRKLLGSYLGNTYTVEFTSDLNDLAGYSLVILDGIQLNQIRDLLIAERKKCAPVILPVMLITSRKDVEYTVSHLWRAIDELLLVPVRKPELMARVAILLRTREQSITLKAMGEKLLWHEKNRLKLAVRSNGIAIWEWNPDTDEVYFSEILRQQAGLKADEPANIHRWFDAIYALDRQKFVNTLLQHFYKRTENIQLQYRQLDETGLAFKHYLTQASVVKDPDSNKHTIFGANLEITEQVRLQEQIRMLMMAVDKSMLSILITDKHGRIVYCNDSFSKITGYSQHEVEGKNPRILKSGLHSDSFYKQMWDTLLKGQTWEGELVNRKKNGTLYWERAIISPVVDEISGQIRHFVALKEDVTAFKNVIRELILAKAKAEEGNKLKMAFLQNLSHELRTPLNAIHGFLDLMQTTDFDHVTKESFAQRVIESSNRMLKTMDELVELSKITTGSVDMLEVNMNPTHLIDEIFNLYKVQVEKKGLTMKKWCDPSACNHLVRCDYSLLRAALVKLLDNALKFTLQGSVSIECRSSNGGLLFVVSDTGIGIPHERQQAVFDSFVQADLNLSKPYEGTGIGLSIAKAYAEMLGGRLWLESEPGAGTTVYLLIIPGA